MTAILNRSNRQVLVGCLRKKHSTFKSTLTSILPFTKKEADDSNGTTGLFENDFLQDASGYSTLNKHVRVEAGKYLNEILDSKKTRKTVMILDDLSNEICKAADLVECVRCVHPDPGIAQAAEQSMGDFTNLVESLNTNRALYDSVVASRTHERDRLDATDRRILDLFIHDFEMSGIHLPDDKRSDFVALSEAIFNHGTSFSRFVDQPTLLSTECTPTQYHPYCSALTDPSSLLLTSPLNAEESSGVRRFGYTNFFAYNPCQEESLQKLVKARADLARLTGFPSYFERAQRHTLLGSAETVERFLSDLISELRPLVETELATLRRKNDGAPVGTWDISFLTASYRREHFDVDRMLCAPFLSIDRLLSGLNALFNTMYGIELRCEPCRPGEVWHPAVRKLTAYRIETGARNGVIYLDPVARSDKLGGDCHFTVRCSKHLQDGSLQLPIVVLSLGLVNDDGLMGPPFISTSGAENLCHEMGHAMHSILAATRYQHVAGTRCSTDFAEMPSTLMEYLFYDTRVLPQLATHLDSGAQLPADVASRMCRSRSAFLALELQQQAISAMFDLKVHSNADFSTNTSTQLYADIYRNALPSLEWPQSSWQHRFSHLVPYGAKYYSYLVAKAGASLIWQKLFKHNPTCRVSGGRWASAQSFGGERPVGDLLRDVLDLRHPPSVADLVHALAEEAHLASTDSHS